MRGRRLAVSAIAAATHAMESVGKTAARSLNITRTDAALPAGATAASADDLEGDAMLHLDRDRFRVTEVTLPASGARPMHGGLPRLVYALSNYTLRSEAEGADPVEQAQRAGEAHWHAADRHALTNVGTTEARFLVVQFKR